MNKFIQLLNVVQNTDPLFFPAIYLENDSYQNRLNKIAVPSFTKYL
jgi:hypothetical protein